VAFKQQRRQDDGAIRRGADKSRKGEPLERVKRARDHAGQAGKDNGGQGQAQEADRQRHILWRKAARLQLDQLRRQELTRQDDRRQDQQRDTDQNAEQAPQLLPALWGRIVVKNGDESRAENPAHQQIVDHGRDAERRVQRAHVAAGAKKGSFDHLSHQA
jgi:hypothetical protein